MYTNILIATDGSELSEKAVQHGLALAKLCGAKVTALKVAHHSPHTFYDGSTVQNLEDIRRTETQWHDKAQQVVDKIVPQGAAMQVSVTPIVKQTDLIAEAIIEVAEHEHCDLIVMASHGYRGLKRLLLGSETQHVLTHAKTPVLVLR